LKGAISDAQDEEGKWQRRAAEDRRKAANADSADSRDGYLRRAADADQQAACWAKNAAVLQQELNQVKNHGGGGGSPGDMGQCESL
jgi:hypothetical protein